MAFKVEQVAEKAKGPVRFKLMIIDSDTPVLTAAKMVQTDYILVKHIATGKVKRYDNQTAWFGHWKSRNGGHLKTINEARIKKGQETFSPDDFEIEHCAELNTEIDDHLAKALEQFDYFVGRIKRLGFADDYILGIGGTGNFRKEHAKILQYKGKRSEKPLLFKEVKEAIIQKYSRKVVVVDGEEVDDYCTKEAWKDYQNFLKTGKHELLIGLLDKDVKMATCPHFNYGDHDPVIVEHDIFESTKCFCSQLLSGDLSTDNIPGLKNFTEEIQKKYGLGKTKGIGAVTALKYLDGCGTINEMFERVVEAYKSFYGVEKKEFISWDGKKYMFNYMDYLQDNALLLWLRREEDELYSIRKTLDELGIEYE